LPSNSHRRRGARFHQLSNGARRQPRRPRIERGAASFDVGEPGGGAEITRRIEVVAREGDGKMLFSPCYDVGMKGEAVVD
jgi:hypothetical protein